MRYTRNYDGWKYTVPKSTGYNWFKPQWECWVEHETRPYQTGIGYPVVANRNAHHVIVFAKNISQAESKVRKLLKNNNKLYR